MPGLVEESAKLRNEVTELRKVVAEDKANVAAMICLRQEVSVLKEAVAELLSATEKSRDLRVDAEKKAPSAKVVLSLTGH